MISAYIDRIEGDLAVLLLGDDMKKVNYLKLELSYDKEATEQAEQEALDLLKE